jgi:hypothetical protein
MCAPDNGLRNETLANWNITSFLDVVFRWLLNPLHYYNYCGMS